MCLSARARVCVCVWGGGGGWVGVHVCMCAGARVYKFGSVVDILQMILRYTKLSTKPVGLAFITYCASSRTFTVPHLNRHSKHTLWRSNSQTTFIHYSLCLVQVIPIYPVVRICTKIKWSFTLNLCIFLP